MSCARVLSVLPSWMLALLVGLGPLGAEVLAAFGHAQVCTCCKSGEVTSCCGEEEEEPATPQAVPAQGCPCAIVAPSRTTSCASAVRTSAARAGARAQLECFHRAVELAWVELPLPAAAGESSPAPPGWGSDCTAGPPGSGGMRGSERASALGVLRL